MPRGLVWDLFRFLRRAQDMPGGAELSDAALLERFVVEQSETAFETLMQRHGFMVLGVCHRVAGDSHSAEDAFQATFLVLARKAASIRRQASLASWLFGVAQRIAGRARAQAVGRRDRERRAMQMLDNGPLDELTWKELRDVLDEEIGRLPEKYQAAVVLCYLEGKSHAQAAQELGWPKRSLTNRLARASELLRGRLTRRGVALSAGALAAAFAEKATAASVPALMSINVAKAAASFAAGKPLAAGILSTQAIALAEDAMRTMIGIKAKLVLVVLVLGLAVSFGFGGYAAWVAETPPKVNDKQPLQVQPELVKNDIHGDALSDGAIARIGQDRWMHNMIARFAAFLPDGKQVVTVDDDLTIRVWEYPSGKETRRINLPGQGRPSLAGTQFVGSYAALSKDGKTIATIPDFSATESEICVYDIATRKLLQRVKTARVQEIAFSPTGEHLVTLDTACNLRFWDWTRDRKDLSFVVGEPRAIPPGSNAFRHFTYTPDGKSIATYGGSEIDFWDPTTGKKNRTIQTKAKSNISHVCFSPDGKTMSIRSFGNLVIAQADTGEELHKVRLGKDYSGFVFSKDGTKLYGSEYGGMVMELDVLTGKILRECTLRSGQGTSISLSPDGTTLVQTGRGPRFFDLTSKDLTTHDYYRSPLRSIRFSDDCKTLATLTVHAVEGHHFLQKWDAATGKEINRVQPPQDSDVAISPDGKLYVTDRLLFLDAASGEELGRIKPRPVGGTVRTNFSPNSKLLAVANQRQGRVEVYEVPSGKLRSAATIREKITPDISWGNIIFSRDGQTLAVAVDAQTMGLWNTNSGQRVGLFPLPEKLPPQDNLEIEDVRPQGGRSGMFSPDDRCLALEMFDGTLTLIELASAQPRRTFAAHPRIGKDWSHIAQGSLFQRVAFSPDGTLLARATRDHVIRVLDIKSGSELFAFKGHAEAVSDLVFASDGKRLASASTDSTALIWDVTKIKRPVGAVKAVRPADLEKHWQSLAVNDAAKAFDAIGSLVSAPAEAVAFLQRRLKPAAPPDMKRIDVLIGQLEDGQSKVRDMTNAELLKIGDHVVPAIDKALKANPPLETKRRLEDLRGKLLQGERLRTYRAVEVLELIGTPESRALLQSLAAGTPGTLLTTSAQAALKR